MLALFETQLIILHFDVNDLTRLDFTSENSLSQGIFEMTLNRTTQWARTIFCVVSFFD